MNEQKTQALIELVTSVGQLQRHQAAQIELLNAAVQSMLRVHPQAPAIAESMRGYVREVLDELAHQPNQEYESSLTLALAAFLEAAGEPPQR